MCPSQSPSVRVISGGRAFFLLYHNELCTSQKCTIYGSRSTLLRSSWARPRVKTGMHAWTCFLLALLTPALSARLGECLYVPRHLPLAIGGQCVHTRQHKRGGAAEPHFPPLRCRHPRARRSPPRPSPAGQSVGDSAAPGILRSVGHTPSPRSLSPWIASGQLSALSIALIAVGGALCLAVLVAAIMFCCCRRRCCAKRKDTVQGAGRRCVLEPFGGPARPPSACVHDAGLCALVT